MESTNTEDAVPRTVATGGGQAITHADIEIDWDLAEKERRAVEKDFRHDSTDADWQSEGFVTVREFTNGTGRSCHSSVMKRLMRHGIKFVKIRTETGQINNALSPEELEKAKALYTYGRVDVAS